MSKPDNNYRSYADGFGVRISAEHIEPPSGQIWDDTLKFSNYADAQVAFSRIFGGTEDVIDCNRKCRWIEIYRCDLYTRGEYGVTIKGGSTGVSLIGCTFHGEPKSGYDIDLGNWSDQSSEKTREISIEDAKHSSGRKVRVRVLHSDKPTIYGGNVELKVVPSWQVAIFFFFRKLLGRFL